MKILVLGASGMIGSAMVRVLAQNKNLDVVGLVRRESVIDQVCAAPCDSKVILSSDVSNWDAFEQTFFEVCPDVVVNCIGLTKHIPGGNTPIPAINLNALFPHRLDLLCGLTKARLIHVSSDCVFSGQMGMYKETDYPDAQDVYGKTKHLGEVIGPHSITLRTSTIGHEIGTRLGLLEWFLAQESCKGFKRAVFSGLPTIEFARVVRDCVIPHPELFGLYHVGASPIDKDALLRLVARAYKKNIYIESDENFQIDRSLNVERFFKATGYIAPPWPTLISEMYMDFTEVRNSNV